MAGDTLHVRTSKATRTPAVLINLIVQVLIQKRKQKYQDYVSSTRYLLVLFPYFTVIYLHIGVLHLYFKVLYLYFKVLLPAFAAALLDGQHDVVLVGLLVPDRMCLDEVPRRVGLGVAPDGVRAIVAGLVDPHLSPITHTR